MSRADPDAILWGRQRRPAFHRLWRDPAPELHGQDRADTTTSQKDKHT